MNTRISMLSVLAILVPMTLLSTVLTAAPSGTPVTYQGQLKQNGAPASGRFSMEFRLFKEALHGGQIGDLVTIERVTVSDGLFTVLLNTAGEFGPDPFDGGERWLEITVGGTTLTPRQPLTATPYAATALRTVGLDGHSLHADDGDPRNAVYVDHTGNVGVRTMAPIAPLDVNGAARTTTLEITGGSPLDQRLVGWGCEVRGADVGQCDIQTGSFTAVAASFDHSLAIRNDGTLVGWGSNGSGESDVPYGTFFAVAAGYGHSLAIRTDGTLVGWGGNNYAETDVPFGTFDDVAAGAFFSLAIRSDGTLAGWGRNQSHQRDVPAGTFVAVAAGGSHSLAIRDDETLVGWGTNEAGQRDTPSGTFIAVAAGNRHSLAIRSDGTLVGWGNNLDPSGSYGGQIDVPTGTFIAVAAGGDHSLGIRTDGTLVGWGFNDAGQSNVPAGTFVAIAAGYDQGLGIRSGPAPAGFGLLLATDSAYKPGSGSWTISSDRRLKRNIEPLSGTLERLLQLRGVTFQWLDPAAQGGITGTQMGLIADEVQRAFPQWVGRDAKGYQTLTVGGFEALTAEALRELRDEKDRQLNDKDCEIDDLKARLTRVEALLGDSAARKGNRE